MGERKQAGKSHRINPGPFAMAMPHGDNGDALGWGGRTITMLPCRRCKMSCHAAC
jgi:hypothetical protein